MASRCSGTAKRRQRSASGLWRRFSRPDKSSEGRSDGSLTVRRSWLRGTYRPLSLAVRLRVEFLAVRGFSARSASSVRFISSKSRRKDPLSLSLARQFQTAKKGMLHNEPQNAIIYGEVVRYWSMASFSCRAKVSCNLITTLVFPCP